ncbi:MAG: cache domain-containing protein [Deltaproteobacteria bacterium]|nr:cache domain-containing protein [Deltaproteobacteria bacterium]
MISKKAWLSVLCASVATLLLGTNVTWAEPAPKALVDLANTKLAQIGTDPVIIAAVKAENAKGKTLAQIKARDQEWIAEKGLAGYMTELINSDAGRHLSNIMYSTEYILEIFVMDNQGANVAMTGKTSDYWQGDERKFKNSFKDGQGGVYVDEIEFDMSCQAFVIQVSVPVMEGGKAIGAITFGVDVDRI